MRHQLRLDGHAFGIRPISDADAAFAVALRSDPSLGRFLHAGAANADQQLSWLARYYDRDGDYYFVIERCSSRQPEGLIALYDIRDGCGEWGRWILRHGSLAAVESAWLIYRMGFECLNLASIYCRTVVENSSVVSFHDSCGIKRSALIEEHFHLGGRAVDAIEHRVSREEWSPIAGSLERLAFGMARRLARG